MKKKDVIKLILICLVYFTLPSFANIEDIINLNNSNKNRNTQKIEITHDKPTYVKHGKYTYKYNKNGDLLGFYEKTYSGKIIQYDSDGKKQYTYKFSPGGKMEIYNSKGKRIN